MASAGVDVGVGSVGPGLSDLPVTRLTCLLESFIRDCDCKKLVYYLGLAVSEGGYKSKPRYAGSQVYAQWYVVYVCLQKHRRTGRVCAIVVNTCTAGLRETENARPCRSGEPSACVVL
jgi:hypothetical protein